MINIIKLFLFLSFNKSPILLFPGLGASKLIKKDIDINKDLDIWPPKLPFFIFHHNKWINS